MLLPHVHTVPSSFNAIVCKPPADMAITSLNPITCTGVSLSRVVPSPNCPLSFLPHVQTVPSGINAAVCSQPNDTCGVSAVVGVGVTVGVGVAVGVAVTVGVGVAVAVAVTVAVGVVGSDENVSASTVARVLPVLDR